MGGGEVSALAARHPGRVARIVYLDGAYDWADRPTPEWAEEAASPDRFASFEDYVDFVHALLPDDIRGPALDAMMRTSVDTHEDGVMVDKFRQAAYPRRSCEPPQWVIPGTLYSEHRRAGGWPSSPSGTRAGAGDRGERGEVSVS